LLKSFMRLSRPNSEAPPKTFFYCTTSDFLNVRRIDGQEGAFIQSFGPRLRAESNDPVGKSSESWEIARRETAMNTKMQAMSTRRQAIAGVASVIVTAGIGSPARAFILAWAGRVAAGVAAGWLLEALKSWGLTPHARAATVAPVQDDHQRNVFILQQQGYSVQPTYSGGSAAGDFILSEATRNEDFLALGTTTHGSTCTVRLDNADAVNLGVTATALRLKGFESHAVEAAGHPIHPAAGYQFVGNERYSPNYMTPSHGTIAWKTNVNNPLPNFVTAIRSGIVNTNLHIAQLDSGRWVFDMRPPVDLRYV
jgi:hypothetical protein